MKLSEQAQPQILSLTNAIARLRAEYPQRDVRQFFGKQAEKLKSLGIAGTRNLDVALVARLGDFLEGCDFTTNSIAKIVDKSEIQSDTWVLQQIEEILSKKGWSDYSIVAEIRQLVLGKPQEPSELTRKTLERCTSDVQVLHGHLRKLDDPLLEEKQQYKIQFEL